MKPIRSIELYVEEMVFEGFSRPDAFRIAAAVERELTRLLSDGRIDLPGDRYIENACLRAVQLPPNALPERVGERVASAIHAGLVP
jgi:hypothetical protein